jgi:uncharacterized protein DUF6249
MTEQETLSLIFFMIIAGGVLVIVFGMRHRAKILEMAHRERLAMIERGLSPAAELPSLYGGRPPRRSNRLLSGGIVAVGFGLALAVLLAFASGDTSIAIGIGGAIAVLGAAFIVSAYVVHGQGRPEIPDEPRYRDDRPFPSSPPPPPPSPPDPNS